MPPCKTCCSERAAQAENTSPSTPVPCCRVHLRSRRPPLRVGQLGEHWPAELPDCQGLHHQSHWPPEQGRACEGEISTQCWDMLVCTRLFFTASRKMRRLLHFTGASTGLSFKCVTRVGLDSSQIHKVVETAVCCPQIQALHSSWAKGLFFHVQFIKYLPDQSVSSLSWWAFWVAGVDNTRSVLQLALAPWWPAPMLPHLPPGFGLGYQLSTLLKRIFVAQNSNMVAVASLSVWRGAQMLALLTLFW